MTNAYAEWVNVVHFCNSWSIWFIPAGGGGLPPPWTPSPPPLDPLSPSPLRSSNALPPPPPLSPFSGLQAYGHQQNVLYQLLMRASPLPLPYPCARSVVPPLHPAPGRSRGRGGTRQGTGTAWCGHHRHSGGGGGAVCCHCLCRCSGGGQSTFVAH